MYDRPPPVLWVQDPPVVTESGGYFHFSFKSGDAEYRFCLTAHPAGLLGQRATAAVATFQSRQADVILFPEAPSAPQPKRRS